MLPLLDIRDLSVNFLGSSGSTSALKNINITVQQGEIIALVGESGSGKSVTSLSILQLLPVPPAQVSGSIIFSGDGKQSIDLLHTSAALMQQVRGNRIAMIFQEPMTSLNPVLTCGDQVMESLIIHKKLNKKAAKEKAIEWMTRVQLPQPELMFIRYPHQLSGGQKQRVMIAIAMCCEPRLLICDEPTTALDVTVQKTILELIKALQQETGMGVIFITHDLGVVAEIADRAVVMYKGEIVEANSVSNIFNAPQHSYTKALLACRPINHPRGKRLPVVSDFTGEKKAVVESPVINISRGKESNEVLLSVKDLTVSFPSRKNFLGKPVEFIKAVNNVNFDVYKGETLGLVGESGCGKTTLGRTLLRLIDADHGSIIYKGTDLALQKRNSLHRLRKEVQIIFQDPYSSLNPRLTIGAAIEEPMKVHSIFHTAGSRKEKVASLLEKVNLDPSFSKRYPHEFSGGQRQRIVIARALALNPSFIVCDESVSALDVSVQAQVLNLLNDLKNEMGFTVIFISHDLSVVRYISDRIMVMNKGRIEEIGDADQVYLHPSSPYTKNLIDSIPKGMV